MSAVGRPTRYVRGFHVKSADFITKDHLPVMVTPMIVVFTTEAPDILHLPYQPILSASYAVITQV